MQHINKDAEVILRLRVPTWIEAVDDSAKNDIDYIIVMLDAFRDDPQLLFDALWYAYSKRVAVLIIPPHDSSKKVNKTPRVVTFARDPKG